MVIGADGYFITAADWVKDTSARRQSIEPNRDRLPDPGEWLRAQARTAHQPRVDEQLGYLFGRGGCPRCSAGFGIADAVVLSS